LDSSGVLHKYNKYEYANLQNNDNIKVDKHLPRQTRLEINIKDISCGTNHYALIDHNAKLLT
jgi:alpha-tubulin suppressor-like RCC1 family protein